MNARNERNTINRKRIKMLGTIGLIGSPMMLVIGLITGFEMAEKNIVIDLGGLIFLAGWLCNLAGLYLIKAAGNKPSGRVVFYIHFTLLTFAGMQQLMDMFQPGGDFGILYSIADFSWPLSVLFMLVTGGYIIKAKKLDKPYLYFPFACGFAFPLLTIALGLGNITAAGVVFGIYTTITWGLLSLTVIREGSDSKDVDPVP